MRSEKLQRIYQDDNTMNSVVLYFISGMAVESIMAILHLWFFRPHILNTGLLAWMIARACIFSFTTLFIFLLKRYFDKRQTCT